MSVKIQINSLDALERLIGGDNELEIEIRNSIANEFTKKYLKGLVTSSKLDEIKNEISKLAEDKIKELYFADKKCTILSPELVSSMDKKIDTIIRTKLYNDIYEKLDPILMDIKSSITEDLINRKLELIINNRLSHIIDKLNKK